MNENNLPNIDGEENTTVPAEEINDAAEDIAAVEDEIFVPIDELAEDEQQENTADEQTDAVFEEPVMQKKKGGAGKVVAIAVVIVLIIAVAAFAIYKVSTRNKYNQLGYINVSGRTIADVASQAGYNSVDEFLAEYGLPADMPADTEESAAYYSIPVSKIAQMYGMELDGLKDLLGLGDDVTEDTPWGIAEGKATLAKYIGEENLDAFKEQYELGDDITGETLWGEVRNIVDKKTLEMAKEAEKQNAEGVGVGDEDVSGDEGIESASSDNSPEGE